jgi:hypothetical protein
VKTCPRCGVFVDERFRYCEDCGYDWAEPEPPWRVKLKHRWRRARELKLLVALLLAIFLVCVCCPACWAMLSVLHYYRK